MSEQIPCGIFTVEKTNTTLKNGQLKNIVRIHSPDWVTAIVKNKSNNKYVLVREFRYGIMDSVIECPCGKVEPNEPPEVAVLRELKEELGAINPVIVSPLYTSYANVAFMDNAQYAFYVEIDGWDLNRQQLDTDEELDVLEVDAVGLREALLSPKSSISQQYLYNTYEQFTQHQ